MKRADIDDAHVVELADNYHRAQDVGITGAVGVVRALMAEGIPEKLARSKVEHLVTRGLLDYGVSNSYAWPTDAGRALIESDLAGTGHVSAEEWKP